LLQLNDRTMRSVAWRIVGQAGMVDDALQDAYVQAYRSISRFRADGPFAAWLRRIVVNSCIDHVRRLNRRNELSYELNSPQVDSSQLGRPSIAIEALGEADRLHRALRNLPDDQRIALVLVEWEGYSYSEVAAMTKTTPGNVGSRLTRARAGLRMALEQR
jgi:RNA polymerase sigma-70 factor (ECF subfamily)